MAKLPAFQFYPGDWRKDVGVQSLSFHDRGVWFEMLMLMHESEQRGILMLNGVAMTDEMIARAIGLDNQTFKQTLTILLTTGVASREQNSGAIFCRRMVKDENIRKIRSDAGKKGGNPALLNQIPTIPPKQNPTPSSSSSVSSSEVRPPSPPTLDHVDVARRVGEECGITAVRTISEIQQQAKLELADGRTADDVAAEMTGAIQAYRAEKPNLQITWGLEKFIGEGHWRDPPSWPRKDGPRLVSQDARYTENNPPRSEQEEREIWQSMSEQFKKANPWKGTVPA